MENLNQFKSSTGEHIAPQFTETDVTGIAPTAENQVSFVPRGATSYQIQGQTFSRGYDLFSQVFQKDNSPMHPLGMSNEYIASSSQTMKTTERPAMPPPLQNDATPHSQRDWNPMWLQQNQLSAVDANSSQSYNNYMQYAPIYNPNNPSQVSVHNAYGDHLLQPGQFSRLDQSIALQMRQGPGKAAIPEFPPRRSLFPNPFAKGKGMSYSAEQRKAKIHMHNQAQNLMMAKGRAERPWDASKFETGEGSSSKRPRQTNSPPKQGPNAGPSLQGLNNAPQNPRIQDMINNSGNNREFIGNSLYDPAYETLGLPIDPHIRLFEALAARGEKGYRMYD